MPDSQINNDLIQEVSVGRNKKKIFINALTCDVCQAKNPNGTKIRLALDKFMINHSVKEGIAFLRERGILVSVANLKNHLKVHSRYIDDVKRSVLKAVDNTAMGQVTELEKLEHLDADDVIKDIITIGGRKIKSGEIDISDKLLLGALREQGERRKLGTLQQMMQEMDKARFAKEKGELPEGEVVEENLESENAETPVPGHIQE